MAVDGQHKIVDIGRLRKACRNCSLKELCLPLGLGADDIQRLEQIVQVRGPLETGAHLFREGDAFQSLYAVRNGALKTYSVDAEGREHVLGFHLPGDLVGFDAIYSGHNRCSAMALENTSVCTLPFARLAQLSETVHGLGTQIIRLMSRDLSVSANLATEHTAEERLAGFLLSLSQRTGSGDRLVLAMPRRDIASYLRLATETVSRLLARFQQSGLIEVHRKRVRLLDIDGLRSLGGCFESAANHASGRPRGG